MWLNKYKFQYYKRLFVVNGRQSFVCSREIKWDVGFIIIPFVTVLIRAVAWRTNWSFSVAASPELW